MYTLFDTLPDVLSVAQLSSALRLGRNKTYELIHSGDIQCIRMGRKIVIPKLYLLDFVEKNRHNPVA